jgi:hypothetical protein
VKKWIEKNMNTNVCEKTKKGMVGYKKEERNL